MVVFDLEVREDVDHLCLIFVHCYCGLDISLELDDNSGVFITSQDKEIGDVPAVIFQLPIVGHHIGPALYLFVTEILGGKSRPMKHILMIVCRVGEVVADIDDFVSRSIANYVFVQDGKLERLSECQQPIWAVERFCRTLFESEILLLFELQMDCSWFEPDVDDNSALCLWTSVIAESIIAFDFSLSEFIVLLGWENHLNPLNSLRSGADQGKVEYIACVVLQIALIVVLMQIAADSLLDRIDLLDDVVHLLLSLLHFIEHRVQN